MDQQGKSRVKLLGLNVGRPNWTGLTLWSSPYQKLSAPKHAKESIQLNLEKERNSYIACGKQYLSVLSSH